MQLDPPGGAGRMGCKQIASDIPFVFKTWMMMCAPGAPAGGREDGK